MTTKSLSSGVNHSSQQDGFTLVEVMVAVVIIALALPSLLINVMQQVDNTGHLRDKSIASYVAANQMAELRISNSLTQALPGKKVDGETEMLDRTWYWRIERKKYEIPLPLLTIDKLHAVQVTVYYTAKREDSLTQLFGVLQEK